MRTKDLESYLKLAPFRPYRIKTVTGTTFDILHPEMVRLGLGSLMIFFYKPDAPDGFDWFTSITLGLIERIDFIEERTPQIKQPGPNGPPNT